MCKDLPPDARSNNDTYLRNPNFAGVQVCRLFAWEEEEEQEEDDSTFALGARYPCVQGWGVWTEPVVRRVVCAHVMHHYGWGVAAEGTGSPYLCRPPRL